MNRPLAIDLFCGAGGAAMGLYRAGFDVIGVDLEPQPRFPFRFVLADALTYPLRGADFVWASPPCQAHTAMRVMHNARPHRDLIVPTRGKLVAAGIPWVIENVVGAPLICPVTLCGSMFGLGAAGAKLRRHRLFEASFPLIVDRRCNHDGETIGVYGGHVRNRRRRENSKNRGVADFELDQGRASMGIPWMTLTELSQAIPPAYSEFIGLQAMKFIRSRINQETTEATA
jgi:DNA (cytosine-5)-methyltransferase 1